MTSDQPHILLLPSFYPTDDQPTLGIFFKEQAQCLRKLGARVGVVAPQLFSLRQLSASALRLHHYQTTYRDEDGIPVYRFHGWNIPRLGLRHRLWLGMARRLVDRYVARHGKPDVIHGHVTLWGGVAAARAAQRLGVPCVITEHSSQFALGGLRSWHEAHIHKAFARADAVVAVSGALAKLLRPLAPPRRLSTIPNVINTNFFQPPPTPRTASPFRFLALGNLVPVKRFDLLLEAFALAFDPTDDVELILGGHGPLRRALERQVERLGRGQRIRLLGSLSRGDVRQAMWSANTLVVSSQVETFSIVLVEAMATGLPVIATRCGGPEDIVTRETGRLVDSENVVTLAEAMRDAQLAGPASAQREKALRAHAVDNFSDEVVGRRLLELYEQVRSAS